MGCQEGVGEINGWEFGRVQLMIHSDGKPAITAFRMAVEDERAEQTTTDTFLPRDPQSNAVAERAVQIVSRASISSLTGLPRTQGFL